MTLDQKYQIIKASGRLINRHLFDRTVVLAAHSSGTIRRIGTGMLLLVDGQPLVITAAHVIKEYAPIEIQLVTTNQPSNQRFSPRAGDLYGGGANEDLDVAFLRIGETANPLLASKRFLRLEELEFFPTELATDLAIIFGMPGALHQQSLLNRHLFQSFSYLTHFSGDVDWATKGNRPTTLAVEYRNDSVEDLSTGQEITLPEPAGMSGGGLWRARFSNTSIWTPDHLRLVGILTEFDPISCEVVANRVENLYHLLSHHFSVPDIY